MMESRSQAWVTSASCDEDVLKALILCRSLRQTFTTRQIAVIASKRISLNLRQALQNGFEMVIYMDEDFNTADLKIEDFAKLYGLKSLHGFEQCAYVSPTMIAIKNCDDMFEDVPEDFIFVEDLKNTSVFLFRPSTACFTDLMTWLCNTHTSGVDFGTNVRKWHEKSKKDFGRIISQKYYRTPQKGTTLTGYENDFVMIDLINFANPNDIGDLETCGFLGKLTAAYWHRVYKSVLPLLESPTFISNYPSVGNIGSCKEGIAIVGMSCRYPGSNNLNEFWELLVTGKQGTTVPPPNRWSPIQLSKVVPYGQEFKAGFLNVPVDDFDAKFFGISPKEAMFLDPQHRLLHELVWEGLEDACIDPHSLRGTSGSVFLGSWLNDYKEVLKDAGMDDFYRNYIGNSIGAAAGRISFMLGMTGPCISTESGCSSAMTAVHLACKALQQKETNVALACGVNLRLNPIDMESMPTLSSDGRCKTFSADANGFAPAEGGGVLILKRLSDALKDDDKIWAVIKGSALSQEGLSNSIGTPTLHCQSLAMRKALQVANISPEEVSYVEMHGTGTIIGDPVEVAAVAKAYHTENRKEPLVIGSVKTNVGHTESSSGITGIIKVVLSMQNEIIPAHLNFTQLNPAIDLTAIPAVIPLQAMEWKRTIERKRLAGVSSFGITGTNTHVIIEEAPQNSNDLLVGNSATAERPLHILKLSTKTAQAMDLLMEEYKAAVMKSEDTIADIAYTANTGRADFHHRAAILAKDKNEICEAISEQNLFRAEISEDDGGKVCFLFTGQGSQYKEMGRKLYMTSPIFQMHFDYCVSVLQQKYNINLSEVLWSKEDPCNEIDKTIYSQPSIFSLEYALLKMWESFGVKPDYVLGHSLGEFAAAVCAGILTVDEALALVAERSKLIDDLPSGKMLVIKADKLEVEKLIAEFANGDQDKILDFAAINTYQQTVVGGDPETVSEFSNFCNSYDIKCITLQATHAFHSRQMDPMLEKYSEISESIINPLDRRTSVCQFISGMKGDLITTEQMSTNYWVAHVREKVNFLSASKKAIELGCKYFIEIGPHPILTAMTMINNDGNKNLLCLPSLRKNKEDWLTMLSSLAKLYVNGLEIDWFGFDQFCTRRKVPLPSYPFIKQKFWPEKNQLSGIEIHPLIGSFIPNATSTTIFQQTLSIKSHRYIKDHAIGQNFVFPGAGYIEMCLVAGMAFLEGHNDTVRKPNGPVKVENLIIRAPLALEEPNKYLLQTVVDYSGSKDGVQECGVVTIRINHRVESNTGPTWVELATSSYAPFAIADELNLQINTKQFLETLSKQDDRNELRLFYDNLSNIGLNFGPAFRSLNNIWINKDGSVLTKVKVPTLRNNEAQYILHPVVIDAMMQTIMIHKNRGKKFAKLCVPIKVGKFLWLRESKDESVSRYIYVCERQIMKPENVHEPTQALLLDASGSVLAAISGIEVIETTVKKIESALEQQKCSSSDIIWEEIWQPFLVPSMYSYHTLIKPSETFYNEKFYNEMITRYNILTPTLVSIFEGLHTLAYYNILRALYQCGFKPMIETVFHKDDMMKELKIEQGFSKPFGYYLQQLKEEGILEKLGRDAWKVIKSPPTLEQILEEIYSPKYSSDLVGAFNSTRLLLRMGENLSRILRGNLSALSILFPDEEMRKNATSAGDLYLEYGSLFGTTEMIRNILKKSIGEFKKSSTEESPMLRICEIGAGTGATTEIFLDVLVESGVDFEYCYTDISIAFFSAAEKKFGQHVNRMHFKKLNIEEDPLEQGFLPAYYDYIIAADVIHATRNLRETLINVKMLLKPGGRFHLLELTKLTRFITHMFGVLDGFWRFEDFDIRQDHCLLDINGWKNILESCGYGFLGAFPSIDEHHSFICAKNNLETAYTLLNMTRQVPKSHINSWIIFHQENNKFSQFILRTFSQLTNRLQIVVQKGHSYGVRENRNFIEITIRAGFETDYIKLMSYVEEKQISLEGIVYCWSLERETISQETIMKPFFFLAKSITACKRLKVGLKLIAMTEEVAPLDDSNFPQVHTSSIMGFIKSFQSERTDLCCRCIDKGTDNNEDTMLAIFYELWNNANEIQISYRRNTRYIPKLKPVKKQLNDMKLSVNHNRFKMVMSENNSIDELKFAPLEACVLPPGHVEVQVKSYGLNFADICNILKPSPVFQEKETVGFDLAGVVTRIHPQVKKWQLGDQVYAFNYSNTCFHSHLILPEDCVFQIPNEMTFTEASTLSTVFITNYYSLIDVAKIGPSDTILIHTATGGIGLSAIQICKHFGAKIIATAGSSRKRNYLRSLGIQDVFNSRNTEFSKNILKATGGRGVDVVLNTLTGEGFKEATLDACTQGARFLELSKLSIWNPEEVYRLRPDVKYTVVDFKLSWVQQSHLPKSVDELLKNKIISPLPYAQFSGMNVREALHFLQKAKHIGKVVCTMPEIRYSPEGREICKSIFSSRSTYLITGGLGGIGFAVCKWMVKMGAVHVILAGRNFPSLKLQEEISQLNNEHSAKIVSVKLDVSNYEECKALIDYKIQKIGFPDLKGVMHVAGALHDGLVENQSWDTFSATLRAKVDGTWNLHLLTKNKNLEHFVLFSSAAALFGSAGQANHSAVNQFEDTFAHYRRSIGLPATSVNWGAWAEVGVATTVDVPGIRPFSNKQAFAALEYALNSQKTQIAVIHVDSPIKLVKDRPFMASYIDESLWKSRNKLIAENEELKSDEFWSHMESMSSYVKKVELVKMRIQIILCSILKFAKSDTIQDTESFESLGVDSLMFVEIKNSLQSLLGSRVTLDSNFVKYNNNIQLLSEAILKASENESIPDSADNASLNLKEIIRQDMMLSNHISSKSCEQKPSVKDISHVLLTGVTGNLGPYVLRELCRRPQISRITCLIREIKNHTPEQRLHDTLKTMDLLTKEELKMIQCVSGNIVLPKFGLEDKIWGQLCDNVDAVFNCAARVQHEEQYTEKNSMHSSRTVNVDGLKNILEFCSSGKKLKHLYHASTILTVTKVNRNGNITEDWPEVDDFDELTSLAYPISKFVGELLMKEAINVRGIPGKVFRFPLISGDSENGRFKLEYSHFMLLYFFGMKYGIFPKSSLHLVTFPRDICAQLSVDIFFNSNAPNEVYNILNRMPDSEQKFISIAKRFGYDIKLVEPEEFIRKIHAVTEIDLSFVMLKELYRIQDTMLHYVSSNHVFKQRKVNGVNKDEFYKSTKIYKLIPEFYCNGHGQASTMEYIYSDLLFAKSQGWFEKFGL